ncbi:hypothetical protein PR048_030957 [Dryococelus australis]|uniref:Uncharacterized protein n=1 Tax=Dryococelus australis TaxID=614101 RepID=A0ABQ9GCX6_9NEOP|nr:hypothetical protein PR048_030957 [Dryococelus australis]
MRVIEGETGDPRENRLTGVFVSHDSHMRKSGSDAVRKLKPVRLGGRRAGKPLSYRGLNLIGERWSTTILLAGEDIARSFISAFLNIVCHNAVSQTAGGNLLASPPFAAGSSQSHTRAVPRASLSPTENGHAHIKRTATPHLTMSLYNMSPAKLVSAVLYTLEQKSLVHCLPPLTELTLLLDSATRSEAIFQSAECILLANPELATQVNKRLLWIMEVVDKRKPASVYTGGMETILCPDNFKKFHFPQRYILQTNADGAAIFLLATLSIDLALADREGGITQRSPTAIECICPPFPIQLYSRTLSIAASAVL